MGLSIHYTKLSDNSEGFLNIEQICTKIFLLFFYLGFPSQTFMLHRTAGKEGRYPFNSPLQIPPASQTLRH